MAITNPAPAPTATSLLVNSNGTPDFTWYRFFVNLASKLGVGQSANEAVVSTSPFSYTAMTAGTLLVSTGNVFISRDGGTTFYAANSGASGGAFPLLNGDVAQVTWTGANPNINWLPS